VLPHAATCHQKTREVARLGRVRAVALHGAAYAGASQSRPLAVSPILGQRPTLIPTQMTLHSHIVLITIALPHSFVVGIH
jgi:hypothetical protein